jgi:RNA polymerase sigma-70 factor (ECF subfamily)
MSESDVDGLAGMARGGDEAAFTALVGRLVRPALAAAWELVPTREDAEDVVQESFARAWRELRRYDAARPYAPWFFTILRNVARNAGRRGRHVQLVSLQDDAVAAELPAVTEGDGELDAIDSARIHAALDALSPMQRACFRLTALEGFGSAEAGAMLGVSDATVRVHTHRARHALRAQLQAERGERR